MPIQTLRTIAFLLVMSGPALSGTLFVSDKVTTKTYDVSGTNLAQLTRAMEADGPNGFWAFTKTSWKWSARCEMQFWSTVTMPRLVRRDMLGKRQLEMWDRMIDALWAHEMQHVTIGRDWAGAIKKAKCRDADVRRIEDAYRDKDAELDRRTDRGRLTGVTLKN